MWNRRQVKWLFLNFLFFSSSSSLAFSQGQKLRERNRELKWEKERERVYKRRRKVCCRWPKKKERKTSITNKFKLWREKRETTTEKHEMFVFTDLCIRDVLMIDYMCCNVQYIIFIPSSFNNNSFANSIILEKKVYSKRINGTKTKSQYLLPFTWKPTKLFITEKEKNHFSYKLIMHSLDGWR